MAVAGEVVLLELIVTEMLALVAPIMELEMVLLEVALLAGTLIYRAVVEVMELTIALIKPDKDKAAQVIGAALIEPKRTLTQMAEMQRRMVLAGAAL